mgnify:CR=1 FL=1
MDAVATASLIPASRRVSGRYNAVMRVISLQSGSNGNCIYVEVRGVRLLIDAGISGKQAKLRLANHGREIEAVDGLLISHDHSDHVRSAGILSRKFGLPMHVTEKTLRTANDYRPLGAIADVRPFTAGATLRFDGVTVETIPTPHDGVDGVGFVIDDGRRRIGVLTDLGHVFGGLADVISSLDAVLIESNYDPNMLAEGPYPEFLKRRISGPGGHLSNLEAAELLAVSAGPRMQWACIGHLSETNNDPSVALRTHREVLGERLRLLSAGRSCESGVMEVV